MTIKEEKIFQVKLQWERALCEMPSTMRRFWREKLYDLGFCLEPISVGVITPNRFGPFKINKNFDLNDLPALPKIPKPKNVETYADLAVRLGWSGR